VAEALVSVASGDRRGAESAVQALERDYAEAGPYQIAGVYAAMGERDRALDWLERSHALGDPGLAEIRADPLLAPLREEPRYRELLKTLGLSRVDAASGSGTSVL
jgi:hypothetical protein